MLPTFSLFPPPPLPCSHIPTVISNLRSAPPPLTTLPCDYMAIISPSFFLLPPPSCNHIPTIISNLRCAPPPLTTTTYGHISPSALHPLLTFPPAKSCLLLLQHCPLSLPPSPAPLGNIIPTIILMHCGYNVLVIARRTSCINLIMD